MRWAPKLYSYTTIIHVENITQITNLYLFYKITKQYQQHQNNDHSDKIYPKMIFKREAVYFNTFIQVTKQIGNIDAFLVHLHIQNEMQSKSLQNPNI